MTAFFAPLKPPDHPTPSGDRAMARALLGLLGTPEIAARYGAPALASRLRTREGAGDAAAQAAILAEAEAERARLAAAPAPRLWLTYHAYYKAPDPLGPGARARGALYAIVEPSRAKKRLVGPWAGFAAVAEAGIDAADVLFAMTERDLEALAAHRSDGQALRLLRPFLAEAPPGEGPRPEPSPGGRIRLLAVGMMRPGDKLASYAALAAALGGVRADWTLEVAGDGEARPEVERLLSPFGPRVRLLGRLGRPALDDAYRRAELFVWPGVNEAYGMVYLEAQAMGAPALAEDRPGVRDVTRAGALRTPAGDAAAFAAAIDALAADPARRAALGRAGRAQVAAEHGPRAAIATLLEGLAAAEEERARCA